MILDGKALATKIKEELKVEVENINNTYNKKPKLAVVLVGSDPASCVYVKNKKNACAFVGIESVSVELPEDTTQEDLENKLKELNADNTINGILLQLPLPKHLNERQALNCISADKDVDGLGQENMGRLLTGEDGLVACTPSGIMELFKEYKIDLKGKNATIINRSILVGKPLFALLTAQNATVTMCHSHTKNLVEHTKNADIIITAVGKKNFLTADMIKDGAVVIDVGINRLASGLKGDVAFERVKEMCSYITPVPGGVGPLTVACLMENTLILDKIRRNIQ